MRFNNGPDIVWLSAQYVDIDGTAQPGSFEYPDHGSNDAATIRIADQNGGDAMLITGRPERLLELAREMVRTAELIVEQTMRDPELRRLYGITRQLRDVTDAEYVDLINGRTTLGELGVQQ